MLRLLHLLIVATYVAVPAAVLAWILLRRRPRRIGEPGTAARVGGLGVTFVAALAIALSLCLIYGRMLEGRVPIRQVLLATYFAAALLLLLRAVDGAIIWLLRHALRIHKPAPEPNLWRGTRVVALYLVRTVILLAVGLPYVIASVMVYRPKIVPRDNPRSQLGFAYERVEFRSADGTPLVGWWIPAERAIRRRDLAREDWGRNTVIVCHGLAASKSNQLILGRRLVPGGFNVLAFDFRAHGESGGQLTTFGAHEKHDVLGAVRWVRENRPEESQKIFGVGASMGAAALIAAAADGGADGQAIAAVATYAGYDDVARLARDVTTEWFEQPLRFLLERVAVPVASAHAGADLAAFAPGRDACNLWPRPILVIHGQHDQIIPFARGQALYDAASHPRYRLWYEKGTHNDIVSDESAAGIVLEFFRTAAPLPVI